MSALQKSAGIEERLERPLFIERRAQECAWPLWGEGVPLEQKRCCGAAVQAGSKVPYCPDHLQRQRGAGAVSEQSAARALLALSKEGAR